MASGHARNSKKRSPAPAGRHRGRQDVGLVRYADHFTEDAKYVEHALGNMEGRENIREWIVIDHEHLPRQRDAGLPVEWYSIDTDKGWVFSEIMNRMKDPGDGSIHEAPCITILRYGGGGQMEQRRGRLQPDELHADGQGVHPAPASQLGTISDDAKKFAKNMNWQLA